MTTTLVDIDTGDRDFDSYASDELGKLLGEIKAAQATNTLVPACESLEIFSKNMRGLYARMEAASG